MNNAMMTPHLRTAISSSDVKRSWIFALSSNFIDFYVLVLICELGIVAIVKLCSVKRYPAKSAKNHSVKWNKHVTQVVLFAQCMCFASGVCLVNLLGIFHIRDRIRGVSPVTANDRYACSHAHYQLTAKDVGLEVICRLGVRFYPRCRS